MEVKRTTAVLNTHLDSKQSDQSPFPKLVPELDGLAKPQIKDDSRVHVEVSTASRLGGVSQKSSSNDAIEQSDLPEAIKKLLIYLRELQAKIMAKVAELQKVMNDTKMRADLRKQRIQMLQTEIMALESGHIMATRELDKLMTKLDLSAEQKMQVADLLL